VQQCFDNAADKLEANGEQLEVDQLPQCNGALAKAHWHFS